MTVKRDPAISTGLARLAFACTFHGGWVMLKLYTVTRQAEGGMRFVGAGLQCSLTNQVPLQ